MSDPSNQLAIQEVQALARSLGVECEPVLVADASNLVLRLAPHPIVARVAMATSMVRAGGLARPRDSDRALPRPARRSRNPSSRRLDLGPSSEADWW